MLLVLIRVAATGPGIRLRMKNTRLGFYIACVGVAAVGGELTRFADDEQERNHNQEGGVAADGVPLYHMVHYQDGPLRSNKRKLKNTKSIMPLHQ